MGRQELAGRAEDLDGRLVVALLELGVRVLRQRRRRARPVALLERRQHAERRVALDFHLGVDAPHLGPHRRVLDERLAVAPERARGLHELVEGGGVARDPAERVAAALEAERRRAIPIPGEAGELIGTSRRALVMKDREERATRDLLERAYFHPRLAHVQEDARDPLVLGHLGIGAAQQQAPVGDGPARRPDLLAIDEEVIALVLGPRLEAGEVGARVGLGVELAPDLLGRQDLLEVPLLLPVRAVDDEGRPDEPERAR